MDHQKLYKDHDYIIDYLKKKQLSKVINTYVVRSADVT